MTPGGKSLRLGVIALTLAGGAGARTLTTVAEVRGLNVAEASRRYPVSLRGVITYHSPEYRVTFFQDRSAGIFLWNSATAGIASGSLVQVDGYTAPGDFAPVLEIARVRYRGRGKLPVPHQRTSADLVAGNEDSQWVEITGVVRSVDLEERLPPDMRHGPPQLVIALVSGSTRWKARIREFPSKDYSGLVNSVVTIRGACGTLFNERRQLVGVQLFVPSLAQVAVERVAPPDPYGLPPLPIVNLTQFSPNAVGQLIHVRGAVTRNELGRRIWVQDATGGMWVESEQKIAAVVGDQVEVVGFPTPMRYTPMLQEGRLRRLGRAGSPAPADLHAAGILSGDHEAELVHITGRLINQFESHGWHELALLAGNTTVTAQMSEEAVPGWVSAIREGSLLGVTGVLSIERDESRRPIAGRVLLRAANDLTIIQAASWWTGPHIATLLSGMAALILLGACWVMLLRKQIAEQTETLRASQERYRSLFERNVAGVFRTSLDGRILDCNMAAAHILGYDSNTDFQTVRVADLYESDASGKAFLERLQMEHRLTNFEMQMRRKDGSLIWVMQNACFVPEEQTVEGTLVDISDRKRVEEALRRSEERARLLFAAIPHPAWVYDIDTLAFLEVNDFAVQHYGYSRTEFLRMNIIEIRPAEEIDRLGSYLRQQGAPHGHAGQWRHRTKDGRIIDVEINFQDVEYDGHRSRFVVAQDVTERKRLELDLRHAQKLESVGRLASGIAHEINTPIQFIGDNLRFLADGFGSLRILLGKYELGATVELERVAEETDLEYLKEEIPKALAQSLDGVERVATIVKGMKDFAHPEQNQKTVVDLNQALASTLVVARNELKYVAEVETDFGELPPVECHVGDLNQVFLNLLVNGAHAIAERVNGSGEKGTIRVQTRSEGNCVKIAIADSGCGIPQEIRTKVFDPFFTTKEVGRGTGQGLAISRSIVVDKHGGTLTFDSEVGRGTTFCITLPVSKS